MPTISYTEMLMALTSLFLLYHYLRYRNSLFIHWPILGTIPAALWNLTHLNDFVSNNLKQSKGTFKIGGTTFCKMDYLVTSDPKNANHILNKNSSNYKKGPDVGEIFQPFGDGILAADADSWKLQRKMIHSYYTDARFGVFLERTLREKVAGSLFPVLDRVCMSKREVDLEHVFMRLGFDIVCLVYLGCELKYLSLEFPEVPYNKAIDGVMEGVIFRHVVPMKCWKFLKWLQIGPEKKLREGLKLIDGLVYRRIASTREKCLQRKTKPEENHHNNEPNFDFLTAYLMELIKEGEAGALTNSDNNKFIRDVATNLALAGRDTLSSALTWFFWLVATNPNVEEKIVEEIKESLRKERDGNERWIFGAEELNKLVYLHAALYETLRIWPSLPINFKTAVEGDTLPSGHRVKGNTKIFISTYAMGRTEEIWGRDCYEFKPERWIGEDGGIVHIPSYKFTAFSAGPRTCLGKGTSLVQMKIVAIAIVMNYRLEAVEGHRVVPNTSVALHMKHGLKVRITKRSI